MCDAFNRVEWETRDGIGMVGEINAIVDWIEQRQITDVETLLTLLREEAARADRDIEALDEFGEPRTE
jgi:hypothetical protein